MTEERFWRVKYGYNVADQVSIKESELEKAIYAQTKGVPVRLGNAYINGRNIIAITPHWHKYTGWNDWYEPENGDDWTQINRDCPSFNGILERYQARVKYLLENGQENLIGQGIEIKQIDEIPNNYFQRTGEVKKLGDILKPDNFMNH